MQKYTNTIPLRIYVTWKARHNIKFLVGIAWVVIRKRSIKVKFLKITTLQEISPYYNSSNTTTKIFKISIPK